MGRDMASFRRLEMPTLMPTKILDVNGLGRSLADDNEHCVKVNIMKYSDKMYRYSLLRTLMDGMVGRTAAPPFLHYPCFRGRLSA